MSTVVSVPSDSSNSTISRQWVRNHARTRFDYVSSWLLQHSRLLAGSRQYITDRLQRVLNASARVIIGTRKSDRGLSHSESELCWLDIPQHVQYSSKSRSIDAFKIRIHSTSWSGLLCAYIWRFVISWSNNDVVAASLVVECSPSRVQWPRTH